MLVVAPNLCFDRTLWVEAFEAGTVSRPHRVEVSAGGKGVNVVRTATDLGHPATLLGLLPRTEGDRLRSLLEDEGLAVHLVDVEGAVRSATIVIEDSQRATVLNEPGPVLDESHLDRLLAAVEESLAGHQVVVCSGSLPPGLPHDTYARITRLVHDRGLVCLVDGARLALDAALDAGPDLVSPNLDEAEGLATGRVLESSDHPADEGDEADAVRGRALAAAAALHLRGVKHAVVTAGSLGAALVQADGEHWLDAHAVRLANPIGAGDSFISGVAVALERDADWADAVRHAVAVAGAAVEHPRAGRVDPARVRALEAQAVPS